MGGWTSGQVSGERRQVTGRALGSQLSLQGTRDCPWRVGGEKKTPPSRKRRGKGGAPEYEIPPFFAPLTRWDDYVIWQA